MRKEKSCGALVYIGRDDGRVELLIIKHRYGGHWAFPKGHVEQGETEMQTALREVKEETGLDLKLQPGYRETVHYSPKLNLEKEVVYFLGEAVKDEGVMQPEEASATKWVDLDCVADELTYENDRYLVKRAQQALHRVPGVDK